MPRTDVDVTMTDPRDKRRKETRPDEGRSKSSKHDIHFLLNSRPGPSSHTAGPSSLHGPSTSSRSGSHSPGHGTPHSTTGRHGFATGLDDPSMSHSRNSSQASTQAARDGQKRKGKDRPFACEVCGFAFGQRSDRNKHTKTVHLGERRFTCDYCKQTFGEKGNLNKHIRARHEKQRPFKCQECPKEFAFHDGLSRHTSMVHREARPFKCAAENCDKTFKQKAHAEKHHSSVHMKLKPCVCFCGASFRENYNLKQHQRSVHSMNP